jgi:hypothetical protein
MDTIQDISSKILQLIESSESRNILGVRLGALLKVSFPNFHPVVYQVKNLRQFIRTYVPKVCERPYSGVDVLYGIANAEVPQIDPGSVAESLSPQEFIPLPVDGYKWKAYSNPAHRFVISANRETGELQVIPQNNPAQAPWVVLPKPSGEIHRQIAVEFLATLSEPQRTILTRVLVDPKWYVRFSFEVKRLGVGTQWAVFRRKRLIASFSATLRDLGIPATPLPTRQVNIQAQQPSSSSPKIDVPPIAASEEVNFRDLVQRVMAELPISELRLLRLPVGVVFDALKR